LCGIATLGLANILNLSDEKHVKIVGGKDMKRKDLEDLGLEKEIIDKIMNLNGDSINPLKEQVTNLEKERDDYKNQVDALNKSVEELKKVDPTKLNETIEELQKNQKELEDTHKKELEQVKFNSKLDVAIANSKTIDAIGLKAHLDVSKLSYDEKTDTIIGLNDQIKTISETHKYLFEENPQNTGQSHGGLPKKDELKEYDLTSALKEKYEEK